MINKPLKLCLIAPVPTPYGDIGTTPYGGIGNWTNLMIKYAKSRDDITIDIINTVPKTNAMEVRSFWDRIVGSGLQIIEHYRTLKEMIKNKKPDAIHITSSGRLAVLRDIPLLRLAKKNKILSVYHIRFGRVPYSVCYKKHYRPKRQFCKNNYTSIHLCGKIR